MRKRASVAPDFVSLEERIFCDREHKKAWPLCDARKTHGCSDTASNTIIAGNGAGKGIVHGICKIVNDALAMTTVYSKRIHWT